MLTQITANYPKEEVRKLLHYAARCVERFDHRHVIVKVKNSSYGSAHGRAYPGLYSTQDVKRGAKYLVTILLGDQFPMQVTKRPPVVYQNWREGLVFVAAHEFAHIRDFAWGMARKMEQRANAEGLYALRHFRVEGGAAHDNQPNE